LHQPIRSGGEVKDLIGRFLGNDAARVSENERAAVDAARRQAPEFKVTAQ
jgi:hypothetical protein